MVPIRKKDGTFKFCVEYHRLNKITEAGRFSLPNITETIFGWNRAFSILDLVKSYFQIQLKNENKDYNAFYTINCLYRFKWLSFGLKNGLAALQKGIYRILARFNRANVVDFVDDFLLQRTSAPYRTSSQVS